ncbi:MAG: GNAT family N-acetyltransferase [Planctomycetota bacterium]|jgi:hypothetical protein
MSRDWSVRDATPADRDDQARLFNLCFRKDKSADTFAWKYERNPDGPAISRVATDPRGQIVGGYSYMPRRFLADGRPVTLMQASDAMTDPDWRGKGIFTGLDDIVCEAAGAAGMPLVWAYSGRLSLKGFLRNGWRLIGHAALVRRRYAARRSLLRLGRIGPFAALAAPLLDVVTGARDRARLPLQRAADLVRIERFDTRVDALFEACAPRQGLVGVRSAAWLNWRYVDTPSRRQECFALMRGEALAGYLVAECVDGNAYLVDHLAADEEARAALLFAFTALGRQRGMEEASALLFTHNPALAPLLRQGWRAPGKRRPFRDIFPFIVRACRTDAAEQDFTMTRWHLADGDRDAEHMSS